MKRGNGNCCLCQRHTSLTFHHLIPSKLHRRKHFRKNYTREKLQTGILVCRQCHNGIHRFYDEMTLAKQFNSLEKLAGDKALAKHVAWVSRQSVNFD